MTEDTALAEALKAWRFKAGARYSLDYQDYDSMIERHRRIASGHLWNMWRKEGQHVGK